MYGVYLNDRHKKHIAINASITAGNFVWARHKFSWMYLSIQH